MTTPPPKTLLRSNVTRYYARAPIPRKMRAWTDLLAKFKGHLNEFTMDLLLEASANAAGAGHDLIRAVDASRAVQRLIPHEIDDFEDVRNISAARIDGSNHTRGLRLRFIPRFRPPLATAGTRDPHVAERGEAPRSVRCRDPCRGDLAIRRLAAASGGRHRKTERRHRPPATREPLRPVQR